MGSSLFDHTTFGASVDVGDRSLAYGRQLLHVDVDRLAVDPRLDLGVDDHRAALAVLEEDGDLAPLARLSVVGHLEGLARDLLALVDGREVEDEVVLLVGPGVERTQVARLLLVLGEDEVVHAREHHVGLRVGAQQFVERLAVGHRHLHRERTAGQRAQLGALALRDTERLLDAVGRGVGHTLPRRVGGVGREDLQHVVAHGQLDRLGRALAVEEGGDLLRALVGIEDLDRVGVDVGITVGARPGARSVVDLLVARLDHQAERPVEDERAHIAPVDGRLRRGIDLRLFVHAGDRRRGEADGCEVFEQGFHDLGSMD